MIDRMEAGAMYPRVASNEPTRAGQSCILGLLLVAVALALLLAAAPARAAGDQTDVAAGQGLARAWCSECHQVEPDRLVGPYSDVPSFTAIARQPSSTETSIRAFLVTPHPTMPNLKLTPAEISDIVDYILSLRRS